MKILITGGAGFIGSHLADRLLIEGHEVLAFDNLDPQVHPTGMRPAYLDSRVALLAGDVRDRRALAAAIDGIDAVFHFAANVGVGQSQYQIARYSSTNVLGTANLLDILANEKHGVRKLVVASSMSVYGEGLYRRPSDGAVVAGGIRSEEQLARHDWELRDAATGEVLIPIPTTEEKLLRCESVYALNKRDQEEYCLLFGRTWGIPVVALRFFNAYGARQSLNNPYTGVAAIFMGRLKQGLPPLIYEDGMQSRDFVDVRDVAAACSLVLRDDRAGGRVFNVGTGGQISILALCKLLGTVSGISIEPEVTGQYRKGDIRHCFADCSAIESLGFSTSITLAAGLADLWNWSAAQEVAEVLPAAHEELKGRRLVI
ncbi:MAG TPA: NAD-dependent epimerase/dehydratase family protein [Thermoanaerobaculia bacterium]|nr:NAD-dependent epimerase/dehydratase family protein [Thermoanaerobaculia bacterium]